MLILSTAASPYLGDEGISSTGIACLLLSLFSDNNLKSFF
jgi:hypothetical protein